MNLKLAIKFHTNESHRFLRQHQSRRARKELERAQVLRNCMKIKREVKLERQQNG
jgi:hypothetical protein